MRISFLSHLINQSKIKNPTKFAEITVYKLALMSCKVVVLKN